MTKTAKKILIIEDEKPMAKALVLKFEGEGFSVDVAHDGEDGLKKAKEDSYDAIITDLVMPKMDGFKVLEGLKKADVKSSVFVLSNLGQEEDKAKAEKFGIKKFFIKSNITIAEIVDKVSSSIK